MTTITVVKKGGIAAIAADTLTKWGAGKESAKYIANSEKITKIGSYETQAYRSDNNKKVHRLPFVLGLIAK